MAFIRPALARSAVQVARTSVVPNRTFIDLSFWKIGSSWEGVYVNKPKANATTPAKREYPVFLS